MPWTPENEAYLLKCALKVHKGRYTAVPAVASLLAGLSRFHESLGIAAVDDVLEAVRDGLEARRAHARAAAADLSTLHLLPRCTLRADQHAVHAAAPRGARAPAGCAP